MVVPTQLFRTLDGHQHSPLHVGKFTSDGTYCFTAGVDRIINLWNPWKNSVASATDDTTTSDSSDGIIIKQYKGHGYEIVDLAITKDSTQFVSCGGDKCAIVWDINTGRYLRKLYGHEQRLTTCCYNTLDSMVITGSQDMTIRLWDLRSNNNYPSRPNNSSNSTESSTGLPSSSSSSSSHASSSYTSGGASVQILKDFHDSISKVLVTNNYIIGSSFDGSINVYDVRIGRRLYYNIDYPIATMTLSNDEKCLLLTLPSKPSNLSSSISTSSDPPPQLLLMDLSTGLVLAKYTGYINSLYRIQPCFTYDDAYVLNGSEDGSLYSWDIVNYSTVYKQWKGHDKVISSLNYAPLHSQNSYGIQHSMLTTSFDGTAKLWIGK